MAKGDSDKEKDKKIEKAIKAKAMEAKTSKDALAKIRERIAKKGKK